MTISSFLKLVEIQTKVASVIPFFLGTVYTLYRFDNFNLKNFIIMFISLISVDMGTTAINNYMDYRKAVKKHGYNYETHNAIVNYSLKESVVVATIILLFLLAIVFGILLYINTNFIVLALGAVSFAASVLYSYGPIPISHMPLGEIFSGLFMGFIIVFISVFIHIYDSNIIFYSFANEVLSLGLNIKEIIYVFLLCIPAIVGIANIMLANNTCDIDDDIVNKRYTLPIFIGKERALKLFRALYYIAYLDIVLLIILGIIPTISAISLLTFIPINKNIKLFIEKQTKKDTFILAVKNFVILNIVQVLTIGIGAVIKIIF
ncbi:1,4-dihydroxy-2-naphthoate polyprenyltransferase [Proteiniborus sp. MB09-C3]|uniref:1,4-dihydroxy-2-naphthoate polyprenyltransferase n=1 Tax=Proteiniborus sp. MB09-C3 TaxID=3050072 RepID=UPI0025557864|nr:1,4-dihydroxy-2-naphthoate polyprenyltransferase [Proteiniborus sp. MB09-C3]WIV11261.1 1,4-dihydroxy-2-naphthoate polyprenyltransferase [Proteiniborus sp. MB09-C3]